MNFEVYCDESRQEYFTATKDSKAGKYVVLGSLWIEASFRNEFKTRIKDLREEHNLFGEFKWNRVSPSRLDFYRRIIDLFFDSPAARFRCIVLPADRLDAIAFHGADKELMFYKFYDFWRQASG